MMREGARPAARGVYTRHILEDLRGRNRRRICKFLGRFFAITISVITLRAFAFASAFIYLGLVTPGRLHAQTVASPGESSIAASVSNIIASQNPYLGSVPDGKATDTPIQLSIRGALDRGLKFNLGLIQSDLSTLSSRSERLRSLSSLLPDIRASLSQTVEQVNLKALGIRMAEAGRS